MIGEGCHFVDLVSFLAGDPEIVDVQAVVAGARASVAEDFAVQIAFADGSAGQILYTARGGSSLAKERVEAHAGGASVILDDWVRGEVHVGGRRSKLANPGKGHREELAAVLDAILGGRAAPVPAEVLARVTRATFTAHRLLSNTTS
jgi:predicted dehydrogenase